MPRGALDPNLHLLTNSSDALQLSDCSYNAGRSILVTQSLVSGLYEPRP
jgi:hypothetical protein